MGRGRWTDGRLAGATGMAAQAHRAETAARVRAIKARKKAEMARIAEAVLSDEQVLQAMKLAGEDVEQLKRISRGEGGRNAMAQLGALKLRAEHTLAKPKQDIGVDGGIEVVVRTLGRGAYTVPEGASVTVPSLPVGEPSEG